MLAQTPPARSDVSEVVLAEFGGKVYAAVRQMRASSEPEGEERLDFNVRIVRSRFALFCDCGASADWLPPLHGGQVTMYRYLHRQAGDLDTHVAIVRTPLEVPICEHWIELPLKLAVES